MDSVGLDPIPCVTNFDFEVVKHGENLTQVLSTMREVRVFVDKDQEPSDECSFSCPEEWVAGIFASIEEQADLLSHGFRT